MTIETGRVTEIPITKEQVVRIQETASDLLGQAAVLGDSLTTMRTRGSNAVIGWHEAHIRRSGGFFRDLSEDLKSGKPVEVTGGYDEIDSPDRSVLSVTYRLSSGDYTPVNRLDHNALYELLYFGWFNEPDVYYSADERVSLFEVLREPGKVFLTPSDLIGL